MNTVNPAAMRARPPREEGHMPLFGDAKREYQLRYLTARRRAWVDKNGPCQRCGGTENLQIDHIDPSTKEYPVSRIWSRREEVREAELYKCQVLCAECHKAKTSEENSTRMMGRKPPNRGLSDRQARAVRAWADAGYRHKDISDRLGVSKSVIKDISARRQYVDV